MFIYRIGKGLSSRANKWGVLRCAQTGISLDAKLSRVKSKRAAKAIKVGINGRACSRRLLSMCGRHWSYIAKSLSLTK